MPRRKWLMLLKPDKAADRRKKVNARNKLKAWFQKTIVGLADDVCQNPDCPEHKLPLEQRTVVCGHHIEYCSQLGEYTVENGIAFCIGCHFKAEHGEGLHGISGHQFMVNVLTKLVSMSQIYEMRWSAKLKTIKAKWNL